MDDGRGSSEYRTNLELLEIAHVVRRAVMADDTLEVHRELDVLRTGLRAHLDAQQRVRPADAHGSLSFLVADGQQRLLDLVDRVLTADEADGDGDGDGEQVGCNCLVRAVEIEVALRRQARLEATVLDRPGRIDADLGADAG